MAKGRKMTHRIPVSKELHELYKDIIQGAGVTFDEYLLYLAEKEGHEVGNRPKNFAAGVGLRAEIAAWLKAKESESKDQ